MLAENTLKFEIIAVKFIHNLSKKGKSGSHNPIFEITKRNIAVLTPIRITNEIILRIFDISKLTHFLHCAKYLKFVSIISVKKR